MASAFQPSFKYAQTWDVDLAEILCLRLPAQSRQELFYILENFIGILSIEDVRMIDNYCSGGR